MNMMSAARPLVLLGCGNMGAALLAGWRKAGVAAQALRVVEPAGPERAVAAGLDPAQVDASFPEGVVPGILVVAVKPQIVAEALAPLAARIGGETLVLSIAAGKSIAVLRGLLPDAGGIVRAMPNTPAAIGEGISVCFADPGVDAAGREICETLLTAAGLVRWIDDEDQMDAVTALSGSGPAYVFHLIECLAAAGEGQGLAPDLAHDLAVQTVAGAGALARMSEADPRTLRRQVTSPGGTTEAGLEILMGEAGLAELIRRTVWAAAKRSRELRD